MAIIESGASSTKLTVDPISLAARVTLYNTFGEEVSLQNKATYSVANTFSLAAGLSFFRGLCIQGSATKLVQVLSFVVGFANTTATSTSCQLIAYPNGGWTITGGTRIAGVPHDSNDPAATAIVTNPTTADSGVSEELVTLLPITPNFIVVEKSTVAPVPTPTTWGGVSAFSPKEFMPRFRSKAGFNKPFLLYGPTALLDFNCNSIGRNFGNQSMCYRIVWTEENY